uniref:Transmembrane protein 201 C-terminal domain-containing protein n=1 Tax=Gopherus agassizii TaxID=38772 RepID=A0A452HNB2_9SAUR
MILGSAQGWKCSNWQHWPPVPLQCSQAIPQNGQISSLYCSLMNGAVVYQSRWGALQLIIDWEVAYNLLQSVHPRLPPTSPPQCLPPGPWLVCRHVALTRSLVFWHSRLRRIDAFASVLWLLVMGLHLAEKYLKADMPSWLDTAKFGTTSLCCLVGFTAAVATRKSTGQRRYRPRRFLSGDSVALFPNGSGIGFPCSAASPSVFIPTPPSILQLTNQQFFRSPRRASSSSLPGRLNRALSLGTMPSLARTDSGYLFSGSRPASQGSQSKESPASEYYSLLSGSCAPSPIPSPAPSVTGSITSSSGSLRYRRPLISPARLNLKGQKLLLFPSQSDALHTSISLDEPTHPDSNVFAAELTPFPRKNLNERGMHDKRSVVERGSICSNNSIKKEDNSSHSSTCVVDTTTKGEDLAGWRGHVGNSVIRGLLAMSLTANAIFTSAYLYQSLR